MVSLVEERRSTAQRKRGMTCVCQKRERKSRDIKRKTYKEKRKRWRERDGEKVMQQGSVIWMILII